MSLTLPLLLALVSAAPPKDDTVPLRPKKVATLNAWHAQTPYSLAFAPDGKTLVACGENFSLQVWDLETGKLTYASLNESDDNRIGSSIAVSADGKRAFVGISRAAQVWQLKNPKLATTLVAREERGRKGIAYNVRLAASPDGKQLAITPQTDEVQIWDLGTEKRTSSLKCPMSVQAVVYSADGKRLVASGESRACVWDTKTEKLLHEFKAQVDDPRKQSASDGTLAVSPDGERLAFSTDEGNIALVTVKDGKETQFPGLMAVFSADGKHLFVVRVQQDGLEVRDATSGKKLATAAIDEHSMRALAVSPDGKRLAVGYGAGTIILWEVASLIPK